MTTIVHPIKVKRLFFKNYCYLIVNQKEKVAILIDPAWQAKKIETYLKDSGCILKAVLLTHHHIDHVHLAEFFAEKYTVPVMMSEMEINYYGFSCKNLIPISTNQLSIANMTLFPIFTPGHTKGAICYLIENRLFTGDTLFIEGCGICSGKGGDPGQMFDTLQFLKLNIPLKTKIYPGHSYGAEPGKLFSFLLENNYYLGFTNKDDFIAFRMRKNQRRLLAFK